MDGEELTQRSQRRRIEVVVSRFNENINWLCGESFADMDKIVYNKGPTSLKLSLPEDEYTERVLPNVGREGHTFLYHIVNFYDSLADVTLFLPGSCMDEVKVCRTLDIVKRARDSMDTVLNGKWYDGDVKRQLAEFCIDGWVGWSSENQARQPTATCAPAPTRPFGRWFREYIGDIKTNVVCFTSTLAVSRNHILQHPRARYEAILEQLSQHSNPEVGHYLERSWEGLFGPLPDKCLIAARPLRQESRVEVKSNSSTSSNFGALLQQFSCRKEVDRKQEGTDGKPTERVRSRSRSRDRDKSKKLH